MIQKKERLWSISLMLICLYGKLTHTGMYISFDVGIFDILYVEHNAWLVIWLAPSHYLKQYWNIASWSLQTNISEILIEIQTFSFKKMHLKMSSGKWRPQCVKWKSDNNNCVLSSHTDVPNLKKSIFSIHTQYGPNSLSLSARHLKVW